MITRYPKNIFKQIGNVLRYNYPAIIFFFILATCAFVETKIFNIKDAELPVVPVTILGGGLAIFLGFRNNAAYDRWWEARKIWGAIVNSSRTFGIEVLTFLTLRNSSTDKAELLRETQKRIIYRHIAFINALRLSLRNKNTWDEIKPFIDEEEFDLLTKAPNKSTFLFKSQTGKRSIIRFRTGIHRGFQTHGFDD